LLLCVPQSELQYDPSKSYRYSAVNIVPLIKREFEKLSDEDLIIRRDEAHLDLA
jgi:hypothetical protein